MVTPSDLYWITRLDPLKNTVITAGVLMAVAAMIYAEGADFSDPDDHDAKVSRLCLRRIMQFALGVMASALLCSFIPSTREMAAIVVIPKVANSESVQQLGEGVLELANEWIRELKPKKEAK